MSLAYQQASEPEPSASVRVRASAKINLHLACGPLRADGFHDLVTVYQAISVYDELEAHMSDTLTLTIDGEGSGELPLGDNNLVIRAVRALSAHTGKAPHARLHLTKNIPIAGGLAGGSADAAAALVACDALWGTGLARGELMTIAATLGSDIPFVLMGGTALGVGRGEQVTPVLTGSSWHWVVGIAEGGLSTPQVYAELDRLRAVGEASVPVRDTDALLAALRGEDPNVLAAVLVNDLQPAALSLQPSLRDTLAAGRECGALAGIVSGSGPTVVFLAKDAEHATTVADALAQRGVCRAVRIAQGPVLGARVIDGYQ